jgi:hypothetical protein
VDDKEKSVSLPAKGLGDHAHALARAGIGSIPLVGHAAVELFKAIVTPPIERRRDRWMEEVAETLNELQERYNLLPEQLAENEAFISVLLEASQIAVRTHERVKLDALRNAIKNAALDLSPDGTREHMYLRLVEDLAPAQIALLLTEKASISEPWGRNADAKLLGINDDSEEMHVLAIAMLDDLAKRGLADIERSGKELMAIRYERMELGGAFAEFISNPAPQRE